MSSCSLPLDPGPCQGHFLRWQYDVHTQRCLPFKYGGCHGNANRFRTLQECHMTCLRGEATTVENDGVTVDPITKNIWTAHRMKNEGMILCESSLYSALITFLLHSHILFFLLYAIPYSSFFFVLVHIFVSTFCTFFSSPLSFICYDCHLCLL